jgi:hypothetical protein
LKPSQPVVRQNDAKLPPDRQLPVDQIEQIAHADDIVRMDHPANVLDRRLHAAVVDLQKPVQAARPLHPAGFVIPNPKPETDAFFDKIENFGARFVVCRRERHEAPVSAKMPVIHRNGTLQRTIGIQLRL